MSGVEITIPTGHLREVKRLRAELAELKLERAELIEHLIQLENDVCSFDDVSWCGLGETVPDRIHTIIENHAPERLPALTIHEAAD